MKPGDKHVAQVAQQSHIADLSAANQFFPFLTKSIFPVLLIVVFLLTKSRQLSLPCIGYRQLAFNNLVEDRLLCIVLGLRMNNEQSVAKLYLEVEAIVFGKLILVKVVESMLEAYLNLMGKLSKFSSLPTD